MDPFSVDRSLPLLFRSFSPALSRPPPRSSPSPSLPPSYPLLFFIHRVFCPFLSPSSSLLALPRAIYTRLSRHSLPLSFFRVFRLLAISLRPRNPSSFISCRFFDTTLSARFPFFLASPFQAFALYLRAPLRSLSSLLLVQLCSSNYISRLPPEYLSLSLLGFFCPSFRPSFLPSFVPYLRTHTHTYTYILHTCRHRVGTLSTKLSLSIFVFDRRQSFLFEFRPRLFLPVNSRCSLVVLRAHKSSPISSLFPALVFRVPVYIAEGAHARRPDLPRANKYAQNSIDTPVNRDKYIYVSLSPSRSRLFSSFDEFINNISVSIPPPLPLRRKERNFPRRYPFKCMRFFVEFDVFDALDEFFSHRNISPTKFPLELEKWSSFRDRCVNFVRRETEHNRFEFTFKGAEVLFTIFI